MHRWPARTAGKRISCAARILVLIASSWRKGGSPSPSFTINLQLTQPRLGSSGSAIDSRRQIPCIPGSLTRDPDLLPRGVVAA